MSQAPWSSTTCATVTLENRTTPSAAATACTASGFPMVAPPDRQKLRRRRAYSRGGDSAPRSALQLGAQGVVEAVREVRHGDGQRELDDRLRREMPLERRDEGGIDLDLLRHLLRVADHQALELREERARRVGRQGVELLLGDADPLTEGRVVRRSVGAAVDLRGLDVRELAELDVERAVAQARRSEERQRQGLRVVGHKLEDVQDPSRRLLDAVVYRLDVGWCLITLEVRKSGRHSLL